MKLKIVASLITIMMGLIGAVAVQTPAMANGSCPANRVCLYECWLSQSCDFTLAQSWTQSGCINEMSDVYTKSVKNTSGRKYFVYLSSNCTGSHSIIYPNSSGDMNTTWQYFNSIQRTVI